MRILLSRSSTNQVIGGAELSARDITRALLAQKHECLLVTNIQKSEMRRNIPSKNIRYSAWARYSNSIAAKLLYGPLLLVMFLQYLFIVLRFKPDVICPQSREDQIIFTILGGLLKIPVVWRDPGDLVPQLSHQLNSALQRANRRWQIDKIKQADHIFTLNSDDREALLELVPGLLADQISVIGSNIMFEDYNVSKQSKKSSSVVIGAIGNLSAHKGFDILIKAFSRLDYKNIELHIVGDGEERESLEKLAKGIANIRFPGYQTDTSRYLNTFDIFVQPSLFEGWGRTVKEAKLFGIPIVGSDVGGIAKQIEDGKTGLLFEVGSVDKLTKKLDELVKGQSLRDKLGKAAKKAALSEGDWNITVQKEIIPVFEKYLN